MRTIEQVHKANLSSVLVAALLLGGCGDGMPPDLLRVALPADPPAYTAQIESTRRARGENFASSAQSPVPAEIRPTWSGLDHFPVDPRMRLEGPLVRRTSGRTFEIVTTAGDLRPCREIGYFVLDLGAGTERLPVYELLDQGRSRDEPDLFVPFTDATTASETYPAGRYLEVERIDRGLYRLDFNLAYNPSCAYGGSFQCPVAPEENRLRAAVRAGEKGWHEESAGVQKP
jgi:uncharacterized protein